MRLIDYDYNLPEDRIAQSPIEPRDAARLLVDRGAGPPEHRVVRELPQLLRAGDLLVVNDTKVIPARLPLRRQSGGATEVLLLESTDPALSQWDALVRPGKRVKAGEILLTDDNRPVIKIVKRTRAGDTFQVEIVSTTAAADGVLCLLEQVGEMPLPPYIGNRLADPDRYLTVYANQPGSAATPTAGLHFTVDLLNLLDSVGVERHPIELLIGLDTFQPISTDDPLDHRMHTERYRVPESTMAACEAARREGRRVVAVGTTTARALESAVDRGELVGRTNLFIHRGFEWRVVDMLMTNFHLPKTTLLMMVEAFIGPRWRELYESALVNEYRFLSFGDAMLLTRTDAQAI